MNRRDQVLATTVATVWGLNFLAVHVALDVFPPLFLAAMRYLLVAVPVVFLVPWPRVPVRWLVGYGLGFGVLQFGLLFLAIEQGMPTGLSSLVLEASAPFTVVLGAVWLRERIGRRGYVGVTLAVAGLAAIAVERSQTTGLAALGLTLLAALGCAVGSISGRLATPSDPLRFSLWMAVVPPIPLLAASAALEGPSAGWRAFGTALSAEGLPSLGALIYLVLMGTVVGSALWTALLARNPASVVAPFSMLVPVVGMAAAWAALDEGPTLLTLLGGALVISGVFLGARPPRRGRRRPSTTDSRPAPASVPDVPPERSRVPR